MKTRSLLLSLLILMLSSATASAQFKQADGKGCRLGESETIYWEAGVTIKAGSGPCQGIQAFAPVPYDWPEQEVTVSEEDTTKTARVDYITADGGVKVMVVQVPFLPAGEEIKALVTYEIRRRAQLPPEDTSIYVVPNKRKLDRDLLRYLGTSPFIEARSSKTKALARQIGADKKTAWEQIEAVYDHVREKIKEEKMPLKGGLDALEDGTGSHEDMVNAFVAICRAKSVPARTVWVPGHSYAEFYLEDDEGNGHWFPCQVAGTRAFGEMSDRQPILQKGDSFRPPYDKRDQQRFMAVHLTIGHAGGKPQVKFVHHRVAK